MRALMKYGELCLPRRSEIRLSPPFAFEKLDENPPESDCSGLLFRQPGLNLHFLLNNPAKKCHKLHQMQCQVA